MAYVIGFVVVVLALLALFGWVLWRTAVAMDGERTVLRDDGNLSR